jgi:tetratricopeptide (TPR) repeat protein
LKGQYSSVKKDNISSIDNSQTQYTASIYGSNQIWETSIGYFGGKIGNEKITGVRFDWVFYKYPFYTGQYFSVFPIAGFSYPFYISSPDNWSSNYSKYVDFSLKVGGGFDVSITKYMYLRFDATYTPSFWIFNNNGFEIGLSFAYRDKDDPIRKDWQTIAEKNAEKKAKEEREIYMGYLQSARDAVQSQNYDLALQYYQEAKNVWKASYSKFPVDKISDVYWMKSKIDYDSGNYEEAFAKLTKAFEINIGMTNEDYEYWKSLIKKYEETYHKVAPVTYGVVRVPYDTNLRLLFTPEEYGLKNVVTGAERNIILLPGTYTLVFNWRKNNLYINNIKRDIEIKPGYIFEARTTYNDDNTISTSLDNIWNDEIPSTIELDIPKLGEKIDKTKYQQIKSINSDENEIRWQSVGRLKYGERESFKFFATSSQWWQQLIIITDKNGIVNAMEAYREEKLYTASDINKMSEKERARADILNSMKIASISNAITLTMVVGDVEESMPIRKSGTINGIDITLLKAQDNSISLVFREKYTESTASITATYRQGVDDDLDKALKLVDTETEEDAEE